MCNINNGFFTFKIEVDFINQNSLLDKYHIYYSLLFYKTISPQIFINICI